MLEGGLTFDQKKFSGESIPTHESRIGSRQSWMPPKELIGKMSNPFRLMAFAAATFCLFVAATGADAGLTITSYQPQGVYGKFDGVNKTEYGGAIGGTVNGTQVWNIYCLDAFRNIYLNQDYSTTTISYNGFIYGTKVGNAGQIAYLLSSYAPTSAIEQNALQAALWHYSAPSSGHSFELDPSSAAYAKYQSYLQEANLHPSYALNGVAWVSPADGSGVISQGLAYAVPLVPVPEPSTYAMALAGLAFGGWQMVRRRRAR